MKPQSDTNRECYDKTTHRRKKKEKKKMKLCCCWHFLLFYSLYVKQNRKKNTKQNETKLKMSKDDVMGKIRQIIEAYKSNAIKT